MFGVRCSCVRDQQTWWHFVMVVCLCGQQIEFTDAAGTPSVPGTCSVTIAAHPMAYRRQVDGWHLMMPIFVFAANVQDGLNIHLQPQGASSFQFNYTVNKFDRRRKCDTEAAILFSKPERSTLVFKPPQDIWREVNVKHLYFPQVIQGVCLLFSSHD